MSKVRWLVAAVCVLLAAGGCRGEGAPKDAGPGGSACFADAGGVDASLRCVDSGPCELPIVCDDHLWNPEPLPDRPWWLRHPPSACLDEVARGSCDVPEALDDCPPSPFGFVPSACAIPTAGAATCAETDFWTQTCHVSADCPRGMGCVEFVDGPIHDTDPLVHGICRQRCGAPGDPICVRCADTCAAEGYCKPAPYLGPSCTANCECMPGEVCGEGHCYASGIQYVPGICDDPFTPEEFGCACTHGTCEPDSVSGQGCCYLPDGRIAEGSLECN
ncbi:MAG: hypothetical protein GXP55_20310 [Deltaproteobacteria bacterium]|nr:hypothetical protein [Deltaproteobacteria bacterium]